MESDKHSGEQANSIEPDALERSKRGYLVKCAKADFLGRPRPQMFLKLKTNLTDVEMKNFLESVTSQETYVSFLAKLNSDSTGHNAQEEKHRPLRAQEEKQRRPPVLDKLPEMPMDKMISLWENCISALGGPKKSNRRLQARTELVPHCWTVWRPG